MIWRRRRTVALAMSATMAVALVPLGTTVIWPAVASAAPRVTCANAVANGDVTVAFVIDFSGADQAPGNGIIWACVAVRSGDNDSEALAALATEAGFAVPRYSNSGLLCGIGGIPARGCGQQVKGGYDYWSYWQGSPSGWTYASTGPAENQVNSSVVQGWRWEDPGKANPSDAPPRGPTIPGPICDPGPPPTTTPTTVPSGPPPSPGRTTIPTAAPKSIAVGGPGTRATTTATGGRQQATGPTTASGSAAPGRAAPTTAGRMAARPGTTTTSSSKVIAGQAPSPGSANRARGQLAFSPAGSSSHGGSGTPWLLIVLVVLVVGGLGGVAAYRWRRTPSS